MSLKSLMNNNRTKKEESLESPKKDIIKSFLQRYDKNNNLAFDTCKFRPFASFSTNFGLDNTFTSLRIHPAIDRGYSKVSIYDVFAPFDFENVTYLNPYVSFGSLLFLPVRQADFELRIAHMGIDDIVPLYRNALSNNNPISISMLSRIGEAGNLGISVGTEIIKGKAGAHTHTETVSTEEKSVILDYILAKKFDSELINKNFTDDDLFQYAKNNNMDYDQTKKTYQEEIKKRNILFLNGFKCVRIDYHTQKVKTFYNSRVLFGF